MSNRINKPKQTAAQLITKMKNKGITFKYITEEEAAEYLTDKNNYLRTATYRKNYQKHNKGLNIGKYIDRSSIQNDVYSFLYDGAMP